MGASVGARARWRRCGRIVCLCRRAHFVRCPSMTELGSTPTPLPEGISKRWRTRRRWHGFAGGRSLRIGDAHVDRPARGGSRGSVGNRLAVTKAQRTCRAPHQKPHGMDICKKRHVGSAISCVPWRGGMRRSPIHAGCEAAEPVVATNLSLAPFLSEPVNFSVVHRNAQASDSIALVAAEPCI